MEYTFKIIIEECEEGGYYAECPAFQGCHVECESYEENNEEIPVDNFSIASVRVPV
ncbi:hypothetical protein LCGC14_2820840 [marine sediment metagenome]|uniref:HicB-like antitoxin of toxin-antitoxin system domain-containing protein n=1 Tax=marine sediment metagenome TaxID=412755 RepID=A0A0F8Z3R5_9ZZZZ